MFKEVTKLFPDFNYDPKELERQQEIIKNMESLVNSPLKFVEQYTGVKLHWYQKLWIILNSKFGYKNMNAVDWRRRLMRMQCLLSEIEGESARLTAEREDEK